MSIDEKVRRELQAFLLLRPIEVEDEQACPFKFWVTAAQKYRFELLSLIARYVYNLPVTSVQSERVFSQAGMILDKRR